MNETIAYCGLPCHSCPIYWATRESNGEKRKKMRVEIAMQIKKQYGIESKPEDVTDCDGCKAETGRLYPGCKNCQIRKCAIEKNVENCAHCSEYACEMLKKFFVTNPEAKSRLDVIRSAL